MVGKEGGFRFTGRGKFTLRVEKRSPETLHIIVLRRTWASRYEQLFPSTAAAKKIHGRKNTKPPLKPNRRCRCGTKKGRTKHRLKKMIRPACVERPRLKRVVWGFLKSCGKKRGIGDVVAICEMMKENFVGAWKATRWEN